MSHTQNHIWQIYSQPDVAIAARLVAKDIAKRLRDEGCVQAANELAMQQSQLANLLEVPMNMAGGFPGLALLAAYLDKCLPGEGWDTIGHHYLQIAVRDMQLRRAYHNASLFTGLSGIAFAAWALSRNAKRYQRLLATLEQQILPAITRFATKIVSNQTHGCSDRFYDSISGLAGVGAYLLCRREYPGVEQALRATLTALIYLAEEQDNIPHWHIPPHLAPEHSRDLGPGYLNFGLAHGIPGPLAILSLAKSGGIELPGMEKTIVRVANWLLDHHLEDKWGINWSGICLLGESAEPSGPSRDAWCYGTPGIARALWLAGVALHCNEYQDIAIVAMQSVYRRPLSVCHIYSPSFCHGIAGLLQISLRFAHDTGNTLFFEEIKFLTKHLLELYQPTSPLGYRSEETRGIFVDNPWLLDGAAGIALVLFAVSTTCEPFWDRLFLLS